MQRRHRLAADRRGAILVETLIVLPLFTILWARAIESFEVNRDTVAELRDLRRCALTHAMSGCAGAPGGCAPGGGAALPEPPGQLEAGLTGVGARLPFLAGILAKAWPKAAVGMAAGDGPGGFPMLCDPLPVALTTEEVFEQACPTLGGFCP